MENRSRDFSCASEAIEYGAWTTRALEELVAPAMETFHKLCSAVSQQCREQISHEPEAADRNKQPCQNALERFRKEIQPALDQLVGLLPPEQYLVRQAKEEAARCLNTIAVNFTWADDLPVLKNCMRKAKAGR